MSSGKIINSRFKPSPLGPIPADWKVVRLGEVTTLIRNGLAYKEMQSKVSEDTLPITRIETISDGVINLQKVGKISGLSKPDIEKWRLHPGDILFSHINSLEHIGKVAIYEGKPEILIHGMNLLCIRPMKDRISPYFLLYWFILARSRSIFKNMSKKAVNQASINQSEMKRLKIPLPPLPEQKRIAEVLKTVDLAIEKVEQEIEHTERLKRGLMQHLLTRGVGHTRFKPSPLGKIPEDWEVVRLGKVGTVITGKTPSTKVKKFWNGETMFVTPTDYKGRKYIEDTERYLTKEGATQAAMIPPNSVLVVCIGSVGEIAINSDYCVTNQQINSIIPKNEVETEYLYYVLKFRSAILKLWAGTTTTPIIKKSLFENFLIPLPPLPEQRKIAEILRTVDRKLELLRQKKHHLERLKRGLMNNLLTGRKRLKVEERYETQRTH